MMNNLKVSFLVLRDHPSHFPVEFLDKAVSAVQLPVFSKPKFSAETGTFFLSTELRRLLVEFEEDEIGEVSRMIYTELNEPFMIEVHFLSGEESRQKYIFSGCEIFEIQHQGLDPNLNHPVRKTVIFTFKSVSHKFDMSIPRFMRIGRSR